MKEELNFVGTVSVIVKRADGREEVICDNESNLLTTAGRTWIHGQVYDTGTTDEAKYIALSSNSGGADIGHTTLASEIVDGNGLARAAGTPSYNSPSKTTTVTKAFSATGSYTDVQLSGLFTASSSGTLVHEKAFTPVSLISGDVLTVIWSIISSGGT